MGIEAKHAYRFGYLKSDQWQNVRAEVLAKFDAKCVICGKRSLHNDIHHKVYPKNIWQTKSEDCVCLCRKCHDLAHAKIHGKMEKWKFDDFVRANRQIEKKACNICKAQDVLLTIRNVLTVKTISMSRWPVCDPCWIKLCQTHPEKRTWSIIRDFRGW